MSLMTTLQNVWAGAALAVVLSIPTLILYLVLVLIPLQAITSNECLSLGYPKADVTFGLNRYCKNLDHAVSLEVARDVQHPSQPQ